MIHGYSSLCLGFISRFLEFPIQMLEPRCDEQKAAPQDVRGCLDTHEALTFRPRDPSGPNRHEFPVMVDQLLRMLLEV